MICEAGPIPRQPLGRLALLKAEPPPCAPAGVFRLEYRARGGGGCPRLGGGVMKPECYLLFPFIVIVFVDTP
jgi:hypothetical protein